MRTATMERESTSMHSPMVFKSSILQAAGSTLLVAALALISQQGAAAQSSQPSAVSNATTSSAPHVQNNPTPQPQLMTVPEDFAALKLAPGFLINIIVYDEPDLSARVRVDKEGNIHLPFVKTIKVGGDTVAEAKTRIEDKFRNDGILKNPQITIDVEQFATTSATVMGEVQNPGKVELLAPHSLLDVIGMTGGETTLAGNEIELKRQVDGAMQTTTYHYSRGEDGGTIRDVMVSPGDTVIVKRAGVVYVLGAVNRPGGYTMQENGELNVAQAISLAQGLVMQAKVTGFALCSTTSRETRSKFPSPTTTS